MVKIFSSAFNLTALNVWLLVLRVCVGFFMLTHGYPKLEKLLAGNTEFGDPFGMGAGTSLALAVFAEFICANLIILGLGTRVASFFLIVTMLTAAFVAHGSDPFGRKELALLYLLHFITFLILGAGKYSLDGFIGAKKKRAKGADFIS